MDARTAYDRSRRAATAPPVPISSVRRAHLAVECLRIMQAAQITSLVVADERERPVGLLRLVDLVGAGLG